MLKNLGNKTAVTHGSKTITYNQLFNKIGQFSQLFSLNPRQKAAIVMENRPAWIYSFYSIWQHQGVPVPIDYMATASEIAYILDDCQPAVIFTSSQCANLVHEALRQAKKQIQVIVADNFEEQPSTPEITASLPTFKGEDTSVIIYTSGTTGSPKGVMLSFNNLQANLDGVAHHIKIYTAQSRVLMLLPLHHIFPLMGSMIVVLYAGGTIAISPSMAPDDIMQTLRKNRVTIVIGVPRLYSTIHKGIKGKINQSPVARKLFAFAEKANSIWLSKTLFKQVHKKLGGAIKHLVAGGAALDVEVGRGFRTLGFEVLEGFGMTEAGPMITFTRPGRVKVGSPGEALHGTEIRMVDGEITFRGKQMMQGYYNRPDETAEVIRNGWLYTGDLGYLDKDGFLFITGRKKEIIILPNGKNVNPTEPEQKLDQSPLVKESGVFFKDNILQAVIVPELKAIEADSDMSPEEMIRWNVINPYNQKVSSYKKIMRFHITNQELPRTRLSKIKRFKLEKLALDNNQEIDPSAKPDFEEYKMISTFLENEKGQKVLPHHHLEMDLGLDSLDKVSFQAFIQQTFGINMEPNHLLKFNNILLLARHVAAMKTKLEEHKINWTNILREKVNLQLPKSWFTGRVMVRLSRHFFRFYFRFKARGMANIPQGPCIIAPNHQSFFDGLFVASFLRTRQIKKTYFYAKEKHLKHRWLKFLANRNNIIVMDLNKELKESIQKMGAVLKNNKNLIIFPEGTRTTNGSLGQFKKTFAILSRELNIPVVPVSIRGAYEALPKGRFFPKPFSKVQVDFLTPVYPSSHDYDSLSGAVKQKIQLHLSRP